MPRTRLDRAAVVAAGADLADQAGLQHLTMGLLAQRLGVRTPSLYKHVTGRDDLVRRIATLAATEGADAVGRAARDRTGPEALVAAAHAFRDFALDHPGRYAATLGIVPDEDFTLATERLMNTFGALLQAGPATETVHALRTVRSFLHGFAALQAGHGFRWPADADQSFAWLIALLQRGLDTPSTYP